MNMDVSTLTRNGRAWGNPRNGSLPLHGIWFLICLVAASLVLLNGATISAQPSLQEIVLFNAVRTRMNGHQAQWPLSVIDVNTSLTAACWSQTFMCPPGSKVKSVTFKVCTRLAQWQANAADPEEAASYIWDSSPAVTINQYQKTIQYDNQIMLDPAYFDANEKFGPLGQLLNEGLLYHEFLHGQLGISWLKAQEAINEACKCITPNPARHADRGHTRIPGLQDTYLINVGALARVTVEVKRKTIPANKDCTFKIELGKKNAWKGAVRVPAGGNIESVKIHDPNNDGTIVLEGKLKDCAKDGHVVVLVDPPSYYLYAFVQILARAPTAAVGEYPDVNMVIPLAGSNTNIPLVPAQDSRGHTFGPDGKLYASYWTTNGIGVLDLSTTPPSWTVLVQDPTNRIMGAPYQPVFNNEAVGGPGIWCIDGNPIPTSITALPGRNTFLVDVNAKKFAIGGWFESPSTAQVLPMSDAYANPHVAGEFIGVGFATSDLNITGHTIQGGPTEYIPRKIATLKNPCYYDALIHEDAKLYCWCYTSTTPTFLGFEVVDLKSGTTTTIPVTGITGTGYAAVWNEPWELKGKMAYIVLGGTCYSVDLTQNPAPATAVTITPALATGTYHTAREDQETQLSSYTDGKTGRTFHLNFGKASTGKAFILLPTLLGYGGPTPIGGSEIAVVLDVFSVLAVYNVLPGAAGKTVGILDANGEADVVFDLGVKAGFDALWIATVIDKGQLTDITNVINVKM